MYNKIAVGCTVHACPEGIPNILTGRSNMKRPNNDKIKPREAPCTAILVNLNIIESFSCMDSFIEEYATP